MAKKRNPISKNRNFDTKFWRFGGGLDLVTPPMMVDPGSLLGSVNYEIGIEGGYTRIQGFERFSGKPKPSTASYWIIDFDAGDTEVSEDDTVTGGTSGATGVALIDGVLESGTYGGSDAEGYLALTDVTGEFQDNEELKVSAAKVADSASGALEKNADTTALDATYLQDAIETRRTAISTVPGSGNILGVWEYSGVVYGFRNNAGGTAAVMYKSSAAGWVACDLGFTLDFDAGTAAFVVDEVLTGAGGASGTVKKVVIESGSYAGNDAAGYIVLYSETGTFVNDEALTGNASGAATADGIGLTNSFAAGGRFEFRNFNFTGHTADRKMYGVDGVNKAFEWDGSVFTWLPTGMTTDTPTHLATHLSYLFLSFTGGSLQHSGVGDPTLWSIITGAAEIGIGDEITVLQHLPGRVLGVWARNSTHLLYGTSVDDWDLREHSDSSGAIAWSLQRMAEPIYYDDTGITKLSNVAAYGDFQDNVISTLVDPLVDAQKTKVTASMRVRDKNQYRVFFSDSAGLFVTMRKRKLAGFMPVDLGMVVYAACSSEDSSGNEVLYFGSSDGYVYQMDSGTSLDGNVVNAFLRMQYNHFGSPRIRKRFRRAILEINQDTAPNTNLQFAYDLSFSDPDIPTAIPTDVTVAAGGGFWDVDNWNEFVWSAQAVGTLIAHLDGTGENLSLLINSAATYEDPHSIYGATVHFSYRGVLR